MATVASKAKRTAHALDRIEKHLDVLSQEVGIAPPPVLDKRHYDPDIRRMRLLENLANWLDSYAGALIPVPDVESMTVDELTDRAMKAGIYDAIDGSGAGGNIVKQDLIDALEGNG